MSKPLRSCFASTSDKHADDLCTLFILVGAALTSLAILPGDVVALAPLMALWLVAGVGQNWVNLPTETLLAERTDESAQGRVYGAHFAWSHLWWAFAYPLASLLSTRFTNHTFLYGGLVALAVLLIVVLTSRHAVVLRFASADKGVKAP